MNFTWEIQEWTKHNEFTSIDYNTQYCDFCFYIKKPKIKDAIFSVVVEAKNLKVKQLKCTIKADFENLDKPLSQTNTSLFTKFLKTDSLYFNLRFSTFDLLYFKYSAILKIKFNSD